MANEVDIKENNVFKTDRELFNLLLSDHTTETNIFWATDNYVDMGLRIHVR